VPNDASSVSRRLWLLAIGSVLASSALRVPSWSIQVPQTPTLTAPVVFDFARKRAVLAATRLLGTLRHQGPQAH
jgi:hypothetical protein